ncbi:hypothetical protein RSSM_01833 [Rhodopirellula sallentina SM41]|uniref:Uncharacterized protein n=1 Tax=Rhodopirellula sallentina SM41 TaxID=1263870 RepID=M5UL41_9BACT|nr:hypothetical protein RSSM_01833 [Rhodopirellula sallentina SM41]
MIVAFGPWGMGIVVFCYGEASRNGFVGFDGCLWPVGLGIGNRFRVSDGLDSLRTE